MIFHSFIFIFCLEPTVKESNWMGTTFATVMIIFSKVPFWKYLITVIFKVLSQQIRGTLTTAFERHLTAENFHTWIKRGAISLLSKYLETTIDEGSWKIIIYTKIRACSLKNTAPRHLTYYCISQINLVLNLTLFWSYNFHHNLFNFLLFDILCILKFIRSTFLIRISKILMRLNGILRFTAPNCSYHVFIFHKTFVPINGEN